MNANVSEGQQSYSNVEHSFSACAGFLLKNRIDDFLHRVVFKEHHVSLKSSFVDALQLWMYLQLN